MKILWEDDVKPTNSERERKKLPFLFDYLFADYVWYDWAKVLLQLVQNPIQGRCSTREEAQFLLNPLSQTCIGILVRDESKLTKSVQTFLFLISASFRKFFLPSGLPITVPRTQAPCVISTFVPANTGHA